MITGTWMAKDNYWRRLTRKQTTSRPDNAWPDMWKHMSDAAKSKAKQKWAIEKPKLENARQLRGIFFIEPEDEEFKLTMKNARRKLDVPMPAAMPGKTPTNCRGETCRNIGKNKIKHACIVDADETMRMVRRCAAQVSRRTHLCKRNKFIEPLQSQGMPLTVGGGQGPEPACVQTNFPSRSAVVPSCRRGKSFQ